MKTILLVALSSVLLSMSASDSTTVYKCNNGSTEVYHLSKSCSALKRYDHEVKTKTVEEAKKEGLRLCGYED